MPVELISFWAYSSTPSWSQVRGAVALLGFDDLPQVCDGGELVLADPPVDHLLEAEHCRERPFAALADRWNGNGQSWSPSSSITRSGSSCLTPIDLAASA